MSTLASTLLSVAVLAAIALVIGGAIMIVRHRQLQRGLLMIAAAIVLAGNVLIWTI
jgi:hypothetical protein